MDKKKPKEVDARPWRVSASFGAATPLGCAEPFLFVQHVLLAKRTTSATITQNNRVSNSLTLVRG